jgi:hypothetical protein
MFEPQQIGTRHWSTEYFDSAHRAFQIAGWSRGKEQGVKEVTAESTDNSHAKFK